MKAKLLFLLVMAGLFILPELNAQTQHRDSAKVVYGCMNPRAVNFNPAATKDNGTCVFDSTKTHMIYGCTDSTALNYNPGAKIDSHNCIYKKVFEGCTDSLALNFNPKANVDNGSCRYERVIWGCTDSLALNYNPKANKNSGYCVYTKPVPGCTDKTALNYNPKANVDNRTCVFISNDSISGCTDPLALNYNKFAQKDNGNCKYPMVSDSIRGCTDSLALNYNPVATKAGRCVYAKDSTAVAGCKSPKALNYNPKATHNDGSCIFARPVNLKLPGEISEAIADTVGKVLNAACGFDYTIPVDTVYIENAKRLQNKEIEIHWAIKQDTIITHVTTVIKLEKQGVTLFYLSLICNQGIETTNSGAAKVSGIIDLSNSSTSIASDKVKAVTVSAYYVNKVISGLANPFANANNISIFPNPVMDQLNVNYTSTDNDHLKINIYSIEGRKISTSDVVSNAGANTFSINAASLSQGMHFVTVERNGVTVGTIKFSKF